MSRRRRWLAWAGSGLGGVVLALCVAEWAGWPFLQQPVQRAMASAAGVPVALDGSFRLQLLRTPSLAAGHLRVGAAGGVDAPYLLDAQGLDLAWRWSDLWRWHAGGPLRLARLQADRLDVRLLRAADGQASWQLGQRKDAAVADADAPPPAWPRFGLLQLRDGLVLVDDAPLQTQLRIAVQGGEGDALQAGSAGGYVATAAGRWKGLALDLALRTGAALGVAEAAAGGADAGDVRLRVQGRVGAARVLFDGQAGALLDALRLRGRLELAGPSLAQVGAPLGVTLPRTAPFEVRGQLAHDGGVWQLQAERLAVGSSLLHGTFGFDTRSTPPRLSGTLGGTRLALADLGPALGAHRPAQGAPAGPRRVLPQTPLDLPSLRAMDADVQVAIDTLDFGSDAVAPMQGLKTHLLLRAGVLQLDALQARLAGGRFAGSTTLDATAEPARYSADLRFEGIDVAGWLRGLQAPSADKPAAAATQTAALQRERQKARAGGAQTVQSFLTGTLNGSLKGSGAGRSVADILGSLDGQAHLLVRDGTLSHLATEALGLDVAQALGVLVRGDRPLPLRCARLDLQMAGGVVRPSSAVLDSRDSTTRVQGQVNLKDESLALRAVTRPKDFSPLSLRAPILVGGTLGAPVVSIDGKTLAGKLLGAVALGALLTPLAALLPLADTGAQEDADPCR